jgi:PAS domain-containing protein
LPRTTERKLRENEERYSRVSEAVAEGIYDWNIADNALYVSDRLMEIFGFEGHLTSGDWYSRDRVSDAPSQGARRCGKEVAGIVTD